MFRRSPELGAGWMVGDAGADIEHVTFGNGIFPEPPGAGRALLPQNQPKSNSSHRRRFGRFGFTERRCVPAPPKPRG